MHIDDQTAIERACTRLIAEYAYLNDQRRFEELAALFTPDALLFRPSAPHQAIAGQAAILAAFCKRPADVMTFHLCTDVIVTVGDATTAHARSRILLLSTKRPAQEGAAPGPAEAPVPGVFHDRFSLTESGWKFAERRGAFWI
jgi:ketosteroid isomerase-like protein